MTSTKLPQEFGYSITGDTINGYSFCYIHYKGKLIPFSLKGEMLEESNVLNNEQIELISNWIKTNKRKLSQEWDFRNNS